MKVQRSDGLRENHSGMETLLRPPKPYRISGLRENHSGMETYLLIHEVGDIGCVRTIVVWKRDIVNR